jgi:hypothetical protein
MCSKELGVCSFQNTAECAVKSWEFPVSKIPMNVSPELSPDNLFRTNTNTRWFANHSEQHKRFKTPPARAYHSIISLVVYFMTSLCQVIAAPVNGGKSFQVPVM